MRDRLSRALADRYRLDRDLGAGGMATVYQAHDLKHDRDVAIKVLHPDLGAALGGERFLTEIRTTARLQHPHILPLLDSGEADGLLYYVMPLVTGETLRSRLERERLLPIDDALAIAREVADALGYAHALGVIHRDIKPENILLQGGHAVVADFGIALAVQQAGGQRMTQTGLSLGTPQYMSPEQAMGERTIDARSDLYALGAVTYEMLTGEPPFTGSTVQAIVAKVMTEKPVPPSVVRDTVAPNVEGAVLRALAKLPADRFASAADFVAALARTDAVAPGVAPRGAAGRSVRRWQGVAAAALVVAAVAVGFALRGGAAPARVVRFSLPSASATVTSTVQPAVAPDGRAVAYADRTAGNPGIRIRWIDRDQPVLIAGTQGARDVVFSPDSRTLAYSTENGELRIVGVDGQAASTLARRVDVAGGLSWGDDGYIYFIDADGSRELQRVRATGGAAETLLEVPRNSVDASGRGELNAPRILDGGKILLYTVSAGGQLMGEIHALDLESREHRAVMRGYEAVTVLDGWLLVVGAEGTLVAQRFDAADGTASGPIVPLLDGVYVNDVKCFLAVGRSGLMVYRPASGAVSRLVWVSRDGREEAVDTSLARAFIGFDLSPRGDRVALAISEEDSRSGIWTYDLARRTLTRLTSPGEYAYRPHWMPDGRDLLYASDRDDTTGRRSLWRIAADGSGSAQLVLRRTRHAQEVSWPAAGTFYAFREGHDDGATRCDLFAASMNDTVVRPIAVSRADEANPAVSPDGRWLAYTSDESGRYEVYVTPFPGGGARTQVSGAGGSSPVWGRNGRQLFFRATNGTLVVTDFDGASTAPVGVQRTLFDASGYYYDPNGVSFAVAPGDDRFLFVKQPLTASVNVVVDWWSEAREKLQQAGR